MTCAPCPKVVTTNIDLAKIDVACDHFLCVAAEDYRKRPAQFCYSRSLTLRARRWFAFWIAHERRSVLRRMFSGSHARIGAVSEDSAGPPVMSDAAADHVDRDHLRKEAWTMALYVTICLLAALTALENVVAIPGQVFGLVWGTTIGLALAHLFAFRIAGRLVHDGRFPKGDQVVASIQLAAAAAIAVFVSIPVLIAPPANELDWGPLYLRRHHRCGRLRCRSRRRTEPNASRALRTWSPRTCHRRRRAETRAGGSLGLKSQNSLLTRAP